MHWDQNLILIIVAAVIGISRLIARISEESKKQRQKRLRQPPSLPGQPPPEYTQPVPRTEPTTDADRIREFLKALGQPPGTSPPPRVQPRTEIPPRSLAPVQPPSLAPEFRGWKRQFRKIVVVPQPTKPSEMRREVVPPAVPDAAAEANEPGAWIAEEQAQTAPAKTRTAIPTDQPIARTPAETTWKQILRSPDSLRTAIILREIFGPPRGLQQL